MNSLIIRASFLAIALQAAACTSVTPLAAQQPQPSREVVRSRLGTVSLAQGDYHCAAAGHPYADKYTPCTDIPVVVLFKNDGSCLALVPYARLVVHTDKRRTPLEWSIFGSSTASFDANKGIEIKVQSSDGTPLGDVYDGKSHGGNRYRWVIKPNAPKDKQFDHAANVVDANNRPCEPIDPIAVNVEN